MVTDRNRPPGDGWICLGVIAGAVGVKGEVKVKTFTEQPEAIGDYGPLTAARSGQVFKLKVMRPTKGGVVARLEGVGDRNIAEALKGEQLFVKRAALPELEEEETYYHADLIGLAAEDSDGRRIGMVKAVYDFGAGDVLEVALEPDATAKARVVMIPFNRSSVPVVDLAGGKLRIILPELVESADDVSEE